MFSTCSCCSDCVFLCVCRWTYVEFYSRYSILMSHQEADLSDKKQTCKNVLHRLIQVSPVSCCLLLYALWCTSRLCGLQDPNQYKFGRTKIFFRAGQVAYLEKLRLDRLRGACVTIQKHVRGWSQRRKYRTMREAVIILQQYIRGKRTVRLELHTYTSCSLYCTSSYFKNRNGCFATEKQ